VSGKSVESKNVGGFFVLNQAEVSHIVMTLIWIEIADAIELHWPTKKIFFLVPKMFQLFLPKFGALTSKHKKEDFKKRSKGIQKYACFPAKEPPPPNIALSDILQQILLFTWCRFPCITGKAI